MEIELKRFATSRAKVIQKKTINQTIAKLANKSGNAIVLDGTGRCTTKALIKEGWIKERIFIPNNSKDYIYIKRWHPNTYKISIGELLYLHRNRTFQLGGVYMDYMCNFSTSKKDLAILFNNKLMMDNSVLGVTFSINRGRKNDTGFTCRDMMEVMNFVSILAYTNGYIPVIDSRGGSYGNHGSPMYSIIFQLHRH